jgi:hypothetical protein
MKVRITIDHSKIVKIDVLSRISLIILEFWSFSQEIFWFTLKYWFLLQVSRFSIFPFLLLFQVLHFSQSYHEEDFEHCEVLHLIFNFLHRFGFVFFFGLKIIVKLINLNFIFMKREKNFLKFLDWNFVFPQTRVENWVNIT